MLLRGCCPGVGRAELSTPWGGTGAAGAPVQAVRVHMRSQLGDFRPLLQPPDKSLQMELCVAVE